MTAAAIGLGASTIVIYVLALRRRRLDKDTDQ